MQTAKPVWEKSWTEIAKPHSYVHFKYHKLYIVFFFLLFFAAKSVEQTLLKFFDWKWKSNDWKREDKKAFNWVRFARSRVTLWALTETEFHLQNRLM